MVASPFSEASFFANVARIFSLHIPHAGLQRELPRQQKIPRVSFGHFDQLAARTELFDVFLQNDLHVPQPLVRCMSLQFRGERQQRDILRPLDRHGEPTLMPRAGACHAARKNFPPLLQERRQDLSPLVVNVVRLVHAEPANFLFADEIPLAAFRWTAGPATWSAGSTLRTRSARTEASRWSQMPPA